MIKYFQQPRIARCFVAILFFALTVFQLQASASPGSYYTATGSGISSYQSGGCTIGSGGLQPIPCPPEQTGGDPFSIDASDKAGSYGSMAFKGVTIPLTCVVIQEVKDGHVLYASGIGSDGAKYHAKVTATTTGSFLISNSSDLNKCGAPEFYGTSGLGSFVITAL